MVQLSRLYEGGPTSGRRGVAPAPKITVGRDLRPLSIEMPGITGPRNRLVSRKGPLSQAAIAALYAKPRTVTGAYTPPQPIRPAPIAARPPAAPRTPVVQKLPTIRTTPPHTHAVAGTPVGTSRGAGGGLGGPAPSQSPSNPGGNVSGESPGILETLLRAMSPALTYGLLAIIAVAMILYLRKHWGSSSGGHARGKGRRS